MGRKKKGWPDYLTRCEKFSKCGNETHFRGMAPSMDMLRREN